MQALKRALKIDPSHPELHTCIVHFLKYRREKLSNQSGPIVDVIENEISRLISTTDPEKLNKDFLEKHKDSVPHRLQGIRLSFGFSLN